MPTHLLADILSRANTWPTEAQVELAAYAVEIEAALAAGEHIPTQTERAGIDRGPAAGRFASGEQSAAVVAPHRPA